MRSAERDRRVLRRWSVAALALIVGSTLAIAATYTPLFAAGDIRIRGSHDIPRAELLAIAGVNERSNVFHIDTRAVERRVEQDPRILEAHVTTSLPDLLAIRVVSRVP